MVRPAAEREGSTIATPHNPTIGVQAKHDTVREANNQKTESLTAKITFLSK